MAGAGKQGDGEGIGPWVSAEEEESAIEVLRKLAADRPLSTAYFPFGDTGWYRFENELHLESSLVSRPLVRKLEDFGFVTGRGDRKHWRITEKGRKFLRARQKG